MAVKSETVQGWIKVSIPVVYMMLVLWNTYDDGIGGDIKYYYHVHRFFHGLTRWSRKKEVLYMERYYDAINP